MVLLAGVAVLLAVSPAGAEFFKYIDKNGRTVFVDEIWKVPAEYQDQVGRYAEKFDDLPEDQKTQAVESDLERQRSSRTRESTADRGPVAGTARTRGARTPAPG